MARSVVLVSFNVVVGSLVDCCCCKDNIASSYPCRQKNIASSYPFRHKVPEREDLELVS